MKIRKTQKSKSWADIYKSIRKPMPPKTKVLNPKKKYDRKDDSWKEDVK